MLVPYPGTAFLPVSHFGQNSLPATDLTLPAHLVQA